MKKRLILDGLKTVFILAAVFAAGLWLDHWLDAETLIPMMFVLGIFLISLETEGYLWGVAASLAAVLAVNYAFRTPYYVIDLLTPANLAAALIMLAVSVMTSTLTTQISIQEKEKASAQREGLRANLLRAISHDLRTPLTSIYGACNALIDDYDRLPRQEQLALLENTRRDAQALIRMVENLLSVTRIDGEKPLMHMTPTVLEELIDSVLLSFRRHFPGQQVEVSLPESFVSIPMDPMLIGQVLENLLENAVTHARGMTCLRLCVTLEGRSARFTVSDDGCGIAPDRLKDLFTRQMPTGDGSRTGMGIGLFVCAAIIRAHGSTIEARNLPQGGAAFTFTLEMEDEDEQ